MKLSGLAIFLVITTAFSQPSTTPKPASVEGKVSNSVTNDPLRKVELTLSTTLGSDQTEAIEAAAAMFGGDAVPAPPAPKVQKKTFKATTDTAGKFRFDGVDAGDYYLTATHAGFMDEHYKPGSHQGAEGMLHLAPGDALSGVDLRMTPHGAVSGRVQDEDGDPVSNAIVMAMSNSYGMGHRRLVPSDTSTTNDRGEFRLGKLPPGHYYISANSMKIDPLGATPPPPKDGSPETGYVTTYFPSTTDVSLATRLDVAAASDLSGFTIQLKKSKVVRIKGQAISPEGTPLKGGQVMLMASGNVGSMQMGMLNADGRFELANVQPGSYMLMTMQMGGSKPSISMQPLVVPEEGLTNVKAGTQPDKTIQGKIVVSGDGKVDLKGLKVMLEGDETMPTMPAIGTTNESGAFTVKVGPSPYQLVLSNPRPGTYLKSVTMNGRETLGKPLDFSSGAGDVVIVLGTDGGKVDATVSLSDKPIFDATVVLVAADPGQRFSETTKSASTDELGKVTIKDVAPGDYLVFAWEKVENEGQWLDPDFLKPLEKQAARVTVGSKGAESVQLKAIPRS